MSENNNIPANISNVTFNPYKHHLGFLKMKITLWKKNEWTETEKEIRCIGNNLIDLYYGKLTVDEIYNEVNKFAENNNLTSSGKLAEWLNLLEYKKTRLSDSSIWIIKKGQDSIRFLHIHPAKHSPFTIRVRASALKTVLTLLVFNIEMEKTDVHTVNRIRTEKLNLSPIKSLQADKGIAWLMANFDTL